MNELKVFIFRNGDDGMGEFMVAIGENPDRALRDFVKRDTGETNEEEVDYSLEQYKEHWKVFASAPANRPCVIVRVPYGSEEGFTSFIGKKGGK